MSQDISQTLFGMSDYLSFQNELAKETTLLSNLFHQQLFDRNGEKIGLELECWLIDQNGKPTAKNQDFLARVNHPSLQLELSKFNFEINSSPFCLHQHCFQHLYRNVEALWQLSCQTAEKMGLHVLLIGIPPTVNVDQLTIKNISEKMRYQALNNQIFRMRRGSPIQIDILGKDHLTIQHQDIMLESATTSLQIHLQLPFKNSVRFFNAAYIASAFMVAISANAPFFEGKQLWDDTRIPLFEQAVSILEFMKRDGAQPRVFFALDYVKESLLELYLENVEKYPVLIPEMFDSKGASFKHLRLHNGTIWRWNRPKIGWSSSHPHQPHLRLEHRVASSGPSIIDVVANTAFFVGLVYGLGTMKHSPETLLPFHKVQSNFYKAAQKSFRSKAFWIDGKSYTMKQLLIETCLPLAVKGLKDLGIDHSDIAYFLGDIVTNRVKKGMNGAEWQKRYYARYKDFTQLVLAYERNQRLNIPVHSWKIM